MLDTVQGERVIVRGDEGETGGGKARNVRKWKNCWRQERSGGVIDLWEQSSKASLHFKLVTGANFLQAHGLLLPLPLLSNYCFPTAWLLTQLTYDMDNAGYCLSLCGHSLSEGAVLIQTLFIVVPRSSSSSSRGRTHFMFPHLTISLPHYQPADSREMMNLFRATDLW